MEDTSAIVTKATYFRDQTHVLISTNVQIQTEVVLTRVTTRLAHSLVPVQAVWGWMLEEEVVKTSMSAHLPMVVVNTLASTPTSPSTALVGKDILSKQINKHVKQIPAQV